MEITAEDANAIIAALAANLTRIGLGPLHAEVLARISVADARGDAMVAGEPHRVLSAYISTLHHLLHSRSPAGLEYALAALNENLSGPAAQGVEVDLGLDPVTGEETNIVNLARLLPNYAGLSEDLAGLLTALELQQIRQPESDPDIIKDDPPR